MSGVWRRRSPAHGGSLPRQLRCPRTREPRGPPSRSEDPPGSLESRCSNAPRQREASTATTTARKELWQGRDTGAPESAPSYFATSPVPRKGPRPARSELGPRRLLGAPHTSPSPAIRDTPQSASREGPTGPTLRANPCPEVTDPDCRFPLLTLIYRLEASNLGGRMRRWVRSVSKQVLRRRRTSGAELGPRRGKGSPLGGAVRSPRNAFARTPSSVPESGPCV